jgi:hypothetical protein
MVDDMIRQVSKKTWYKWSVYINIILFLIIIIFLYLLVRDTLDYNRDGGETWLNITRDIAFIVAALALIFIQLFRNLFTIMRRSL